MKKIIGLVTLASMLLLAVPVGAKDIIADNTGDIPVNGTLGMDNTDPDAPINEKTDDWINVSLPMDTIFYNVNPNKNITSPDYTIINNSGRPVEVLFSKLGNDTEQNEIDYDLLLKGFTNNPQIVDSGEAQDKSSAPELLQTLANKEGKLEKEGVATLDSNKVVYGYTGTVNQVDFDSKVEYNYDMTLEFKAVDWTTP